MYIISGEFFESFAVDPNRNLPQYQPLWQRFNCLQSQTKCDCLYNSVLITHLSEYLLIIRYY